MTKELPRILISGGILLLFAYAFARNPSSQLLIGAIISMATSASNYWLGTSKGSTDKAEQLADSMTGTKDNPTVVEGAPAGSAAVITTPERKG